MDFNDVLIEFFEQNPNLNIEQYEQVLDEVPITNFGRFYVCTIFTVRVLRHRPRIVLGVLNYWVCRVS